MSVVQVCRCDWQRILIEARYRDQPPSVPVYYTLLTPYRYARSRVDYHRRRRATGVITTSVLRGEKSTSVRSVQRLRVEEIISINTCWQQRFTEGPGWITLFPRLRRRYAVPYKRASNDHDYRGRRVRDSALRTSSGRSPLLTYLQMFSSHCTRRTHRKTGKAEREEEEGGEGFWQRATCRSCSTGNTWTTTWSLSALSASYLLRLGAWLVRAPLLADRPLGGTWRFGSNGIGDPRRGQPGAYSPRWESNAIEQ